MTKPNRAAQAAAGDSVRPDDIQPDGDAQPEAEAPEGDGLVEVQFEGRPYAVPPELKGALMRQADYTRKTQDLAQHRQALQAAGQALATAAQAHQANLMEHGRAAVLGDQVAQLSGLNWPALQQQNPAQAQALMHQLFQMRQAHEIAVAGLRHKSAVQAFDRQRQHAKQVGEAHVVLSREIDGWSPETGRKLAQYAIGQGMTPEELDELSDPRLVRILHHAHAGHEAQQQKSAAERLTQAQAIRPAIEVGGTGGGPKDPTRMSTDDWMRHRRGQLRSKAR